MGDVQREEVEYCATVSQNEEKAMLDKHDVENAFYVSNGQKALREIVRIQTKQVSPLQDRVALVQDETALVTKQKKTRTNPRCKIKNFHSKPDSIQVIVLYTLLQTQSHCVSPRLLAHTHRKQFHHRLF